MIVFRAFGWFDAKILSVVEKFTQWFQKMTGKTNYFLLGMSSIVLAGITLVILWSGAIRNPSQDTLFGVIFDFMRQHYFLTFLFILVLVRRGFYHWQILEAESFKRLADGLANPKKNNTFDICWRLFWLMFLGIYNNWLCLNQGLFLGSLINTLIWVEDYLEACDPLPPCRGKISEWLQGTFLKPAYENANN